MQSYEFIAHLHRSENAGEQQIEPEFYIQNTGTEDGKGSVHTGVHHELQLVLSPAYARVHPDVPIHVHRNPNTGAHFVCWTPPLRTVDAARELFDWWCVGTAFAIEKSQDFASLIADHQNDFLEFMEREHGFVLAK